MADDIKNEQHEQNKKEQQGHNVISKLYIQLGTKFTQFITHGVGGSVGGGVGRGVGGGVGGLIMKQTRKNNFTVN